MPRHAILLLLRSSIEYSTEDQQLVRWVLFLHRAPYVNYYCREEERGSAASLSLSLVLKQASIGYATKEEKKTGNEGWEWN